MHVVAGHVAVAGAVIAGLVAPAALPAPAHARPTAHARSDFNGDGFDDLAVGMPGLDIDDVDHVGVVIVLYGTAAGLDDDGAQRLVQPTTARVIPKDAEAFGLAVAAGDFDADGFTDLAAGAPGTDVGAVDGAGTVTVFYGSPAGLDPTTAQLWSEDTAGVVDTAEDTDRFGTVLAAGDVGRGGADDLVVGMPLEDVGGFVDAGAAHVFYGSASGITAAGDERWTQSTAGIEDDPGAGDHFGWAAAIGDVDGDAVGDLVLGAPEDTVGAAARAGAVHVIPGTADGLTAAGSTRWTQDSTDVPDSAERGDGFGTSVAVGDLLGGTEEDVAAGSPGEGVSGNALAGAVHVLPGSPSGVTGAGSGQWTQGAGGVAEQAERGDNFGTALAIGDFGGGAGNDLAVAAFDEQIGSAPRTGGVVVLYRGAAGVGGGGSQAWSQDKAGVPEVAEHNDHFGAVLAAGAFGGGPEADLAIGVPNESVGAVLEAGIVQVLLGSSSGLVAAGSQLWSEADPGIPDDPAPEDKFGFAFG
jgi:hypothetical protein